MPGDGHAGFGGRAGETHWEQSRQGAPVRPNNLGEAAERAVARHRQCLRVLVPDREGTADEPAPSDEKADSPWRSERFANRVRARHATVHALLEAGHSRRSIGRQLNMTHRTDLSRPETLTEIEQLRLKTVLANCPELDALTGHVRSFAQMLTERQGERLPRWLDAVRQDDLPSLHTLAAGIDRDRDAVIAGLTLPWNSGVVQGHVNRIKMLKRQMFGRAGFALLRKRVLLAP